MQYWVNSEGHMLAVVDVTKMKGSACYRKRVKHNRYVVSYSLLPFKFEMSLSFDAISGVRYWMKKFGYKLQEDKTYA